MLNLKKTQGIARHSGDILGPMGWPIGFQVGRRIRLVSSIKFQVLVNHLFEIPEILAIRINIWKTNGKLIQLIAGMVSWHLQDWTADCLTKGLTLKPWISPITDSSMSEGFRTHQPKVRHWHTRWWIAAKSSTARIGLPWDLLGDDLLRATLGERMAQFLWFVIGGLHRTCRITQYFEIWGLIETSMGLPSVIFSVGSNGMPWEYPKSAANEPQNQCLNPLVLSDGFKDVMLLKLC